MQKINNFTRNCFNILVHHCFLRMTPPSLEYSFTFLCKGPRNLRCESGSNPMYPVCHTHSIKLFIPKKLCFQYFFPVSVGREETYDVHMAQSPEHSKLLATMPLVPSIPHVHPSGSHDESMRQMDVLMQKHGLTDTQHAGNEHPMYKQEIQYNNVCITNTALSHFNEINS